jgi:3-methyl-2-oxobutanoate hydroxymethyltransferase
VPEASSFRRMKSRGDRIAVVTAYDAPTAALEVEAGADLLLVGDSVGVNVLGYAHECEVTLDDIVHHLAAVRRGAPNTYIITDLPYATYDTPAQAIDSARRLRDAGADCVKFEGGRREIAQALTQAGFDLCGHLGLESQHQPVKRRQGRDAAAATKIYDDACALDAVGAKFLVLELVPQELAGRITRDIGAVTIGIGSGPETDGQVLVVNDLAGMTRRDFRHNRRYGTIGAAMRDAVAAYVQDVRAGAFPGPEHAFQMPPEELAAFKRIRP